MKKECKLKPGDRVRSHWGQGFQYNDKQGKVLSIEEGHCESGWMITTDFTDRPLDTNWFIKFDQTIPEIELDQETLNIVESFEALNKLIKAHMNSVLGITSDRIGK